MASPRYQGETKDGATIAPTRTSHVRVEVQEESPVKTKTQSFMKANTPPPRNSRITESMVEMYNTLICSSSFVEPIAIEADSKTITAGQALGHMCGNCGRYSCCFCFPPDETCKNLGILANVSVAFCGATTFGVGRGAVRSLTESCKPKDAPPPPQVMPQEMKIR